MEHTSCGLTGWVSNLSFQGGKIMRWQKLSIRIKISEFYYVKIVSLESPFVKRWWNVAAIINLLYTENLWVKKGEFLENSQVTQSLTSHSSFPHANKRGKKQTINLKSLDRLRKMWWKGTRQEEEWVGRVGGRQQCQIPV